MENEIKILILEDVLTDLELVLYELKKAEISFNYHHVETEEGFKKGLVEFNPDIILSDYNLPQFTGMEALKLAKEISPLIPLIIVTGHLNEEIAVGCIKAGAIDYVLKENLTRLGPAVHSALERKALAAAKIKSEQDLRESEEFNRRIIESSNDCIKLLDLDGNLLFMSCGGQNLLEIDDITPFLNKSWLDNWNGSDRQSAQEAIKKAKTGYIGTFQGYCPTMKGTPKWWDISITAVTDSGGEIKSLLAISRDITEQKLAEIERINNQKKFQNFFELNPLGVCTVDTEGKIFHCNSTLEKMLGFSKKELLNKRLIDYTHPDDMQKSLKYLKEFIGGEKNKFLFEKRYIKKDGSIIWANLTVISYRDDQQKLTMNLVLEDITERRAAKEAIKQSEKKFRSVIESANDAVVIADSKGKIIMWNKGAQNIFSYTSEEIINRPITILVPEIYRNKHQQGFSRFMKTKIPSLIGSTVEVEGLRKDGSVFPLSISLSYWESESSIYFSAIIKDISVRINTERMLRENEAKFRILVENVGEGIGMTDVNDNFVFVNKEAEKIFALKKDELIGSSLSDFIDQETAEFIKNQTQLRKAGQSSRYDFTITSKDKMVKFLMVTATPNFDDSGNFIGTFGIFHDVTERKIVEDKLQESNLMIEGIINSIPARVFWKDKNLVYLGCNEIFARDAGYTEPRELIGKDDYQMGWRDQAELYRRDDLQVIESGSPKLLIEEQQTTPDGNTITLLTSKIPLRNSQGEIDGILGTYLDISDRKQIEEKLRMSETMHKNAQNVAHIGHWELDPKVGTPVWSDEIFRIFGLDPNEGEPSFTDHEIYTHPNDWPILNEAVNKAFQDGMPFDIMFRLVRLSGAIRWMHAIGTTQIDEDGKVKKLFGTAQDVTERMRAEILNKLNYEISQLKFEFKTIKDLFAETHQILSKGIKIKNLYFAMHDSNTDLLEYPYWVDENDKLHSRKLSGSNSLTEIIIKEMKSFVLDREEFRRMIDNKNIKFYGTVPESWMGVPLIANKKASGAIVIQSYRAETVYSNEDLQLLQSVSEKISLLIENKKAADALKESEEKYRLIVENAHDGIEITQDDKIIFVNSCFAEMLGYRSEELINSKFSIVYTENAFKDLLQRQKTRKGGQQGSEYYETEYFRKDKTIIDVEIKYEIIQYNGKPATFAIVRDITERKKNEEELRRHRENLEELIKERTEELELSHIELKKLSKAVEQSPAVVVITDPEGNIEYANYTFTEITGFDIKEVFGKNPRILKSGYHPKSFYKNLWETILGGKIWKGEIKNKKKDGTFIWESTYISPIMDENKEIVNFVAVKQDITEQKLAIEQLVKSEKELTIAKETAENATLAKSQFLANMSHEIRTPMNAILGLNYLIKKSELTSQQYNYIISQENSVKNLMGIINDILDFSKIEAGKLSIESIEFELHEIISNLADMIRLKARSKKLELIFKIDPAIPNILFGDPLRLSQVLLNLTSNAIKFTENGEVLLTVKLIKRTTADIKIHFVISDTGIGLTKTQQQNLFKPFTQADSSTSRKYGGTGLGLSISKRLIELMAGEIGFTSKYKQGSTFYFTLTFKKVIQKKTQKNYSLLRGLKVLIVEDNIPVQEIYANYFQMFKMLTHTADDGKQAIQELERVQRSDIKKYDLIVLDWAMPVMSGEETIYHILKEKLFDPNRILITSGFIGEFEIEKLDKIGVKHVLQKPVTPSKLYDTLINVIRLGKDKKHIKEFSTNEYKEIAGKKILLVEDQELNRQVAMEILESEGLKVDTAVNGSIAVKKIKKTNYAAVLMDLQMPVLDGYEATRKIRKFIQSKELPIIAMTADAIVGVKEECLKAGMDDFVAKPIEPKKLFITLKKWIKKGDKIENQTKPRSRPKMKKDKGYPEITHLNMEKGIERLNGNVESYINIILKFRKNNLKTLELLKNSIKANKIEEAEKQVHAIKGVSGNISAEKLFEISTELDDILKKNKIEKIDDAMKDFEKEFRNVLNSIEKYEKQTKLGQKNKILDDIKVEVNFDQEIDELKPMLKVLEKSLKENNAKSKELLATLKEKAHSNPMLEIIENISDCLDNYNFDEGYKLLIGFEKKYNI